LEYASAEGGVWNARLRQAKLSGLRVDTLSWRIAVPSLLSGTLDVDANFERGDIEGRARVQAGFGGRRRIEMPALRIRGVEFAGAAFPGETTLSDIEVVFLGGRCVEASGQAASDMLVRPPEGLAWRGPPLSGAASCEGEDAVIGLAGETPEGDAATAQIRLRPNGTGAWRLQIAAARSETAALLLGNGFTPDPRGGSSMSGEMRWFPF
jgi:hypothetical protein